LLGLLAWRADWGQIAEVFSGLRPGLWLLAVALYALTQVVSSLRWQRLAQPLGFHQSLGQFLSYYYIGMFFNLVLPTSVGGDVVRAWYLGGRSGRRLPAFLSVLADRVSGVVILLMLGLAALALCPVHLPVHLAAGVAGMSGGLLLALLVLFWISRRQIETHEFKTRQRAGWRGWFLNLQFLILNLQSSISPTPRILFETTVLSVVVQLANVLVVWLVGLALGMAVPGSYYLVLVPAVTLLTLLPISVNGMGVREGATLVFLEPLGVPAGTALTLAFLWFAVFAVPSLAGAGFYLFGRFPRFSAQEVRPDDEFVGGDSHQGRARQPGTAA
jgi:uncharacterized protein (TIRG00374 family)